MPLKEFPIDKDNIELTEYYKFLIWESNLDYKLDFIAKEVLSYGFNNKKADCTLEDMIAASKYQFLETSSSERFLYFLKEKDKDDKFKLPNDLINPSNDNEEYKQKEKDFVKNPVNFIKEYAIAEANKNIDESDIEQVKWKNHCKSMINTLDELNYNEKNAQPKITTLLVNRSRYNGKAKTCDDILEKNKGGFFERLFKTTSNEYINFKNTFKAYNDKKSQEFGNKEALKASALAYVRHKLPNLSENVEPSYNDIENLEGTSYNRAMLCLSIIEQLNKQEKMDELNNNFNNINKVNDQNEFHNDLEKSVENSIQLNSQIDELDNVLINENGIMNK